MTTLRDLIRNDIYNYYVIAPEELDFSQTSREELAKTLLDEIIVTLKSYFEKNIN
jgi:hypothetical protein